MVKIFLTGATGYIGGEALYHLYHTGRHEIAALVRDEKKESAVSRAFPQVQIVRGDLDDVELIEREAQKVDVVLNLASTKHLPSAQAIARAKPKYWIQMSGASMFSIPDISQHRYGEAPTVSYNDRSDSEDIRSIIRNNPSRTVDNLILDQDSKLKTALIPGFLIYGVGQGQVHTRSIQVPEMAKAILQRGEGFRVGAGESVWSNIHVRDLGAFVATLVGAADEGKADCWDENGIYLVENGKLSFGDLAKRIAQEGHKQGLIRSGEVMKSITPEEADAIMPAGSIFWATNAVGQSARAQKQVDWRPEHPKLEETIADVVAAEADNVKPRV